MNAAWAAGLLGAALLGSLHCAGMCGGFVACYAAPLTRRGALAGHATYHLARWFVYAGLGALAGGLGAGLDRLVRPGGVTSLSAWFACLGLIASGLYGLLRARRGAGASGAEVPAPLLRLGRTPRRLRPALFGALTPLLPCGVLYGFVWIAAGTGSVLGGAQVLTLLWLGSAPALLGLGWLVASVSPRLRGRVPLLLSLFALAGGVVGLGLRAGALVDPSDGPPACHGDPR